MIEQLKIKIENYRLEAVKDSLNTKQDITYTTESVINMLDDLALIIKSDNPIVDYNTSADADKSENSKYQLFHIEDIKAELKLPLPRDIIELNYHNMLSNKGVLLYDFLRYCNTEEVWESETHLFRKM